MRTHLSFFSILSLISVLIGACSVEISTGDNPTAIPVGRSSLVTASPPPLAAIEPPTIPTPVHVPMITSTPTVVPPPIIAVCHAIRDGDVDGSRLISGPASVELWHRKDPSWQVLVFIPHGRSVSFASDYGGAYWRWPEDCTTEDVMEEEYKQGKNPVPVDDLPPGIVQ